MGQLLLIRKARPKFGRSKAVWKRKPKAGNHPARTLSNAKPPWVSQELIDIKAHAFGSGCRAIADIFNRRFAAETGVTVGKTFVAKVLREHMADIQGIRRAWKRRIPRRMPRNIVWGMDLTGITDSVGYTHDIFGIIDHGSRRCLGFMALKDKTSISLLKALIHVVELFGKPKLVRTDNEAVFTSRLFRFGLWLLGIRHQRTELHCPWQNGRIERFFGTFKAIADKVVVDAKRLQTSLDEFSIWYNRVRPHRHLDGRTPDEAWHRISPLQSAPKSCRCFSAWDGLLTGYFLQYE